MNAPEIVYEARRKTVYQADQNGFFVYAEEVYELFLAPGTFSIPFGASEKVPPQVSEGFIQKLVDGEWAVVEDHRSDALFYLAEKATDDKPAVFERYEFGAVVDVGGDEVSYDGGGPVPHWLTSMVPAVEQLPKIA